MDPFDVIAQNEQIADALNVPFDIELQEDDDPWFRIEGTEFRVVAGDGGGNQYARLADGSIAFIDHESYAGVIAESSRELFELIVNAPYWHDLLKFSGGGQLPEMRRVQPLLERELEADDLDEDFYDPGDKVADRRPMLRKAFGVSPDVDVVAKLHAAVSKPRGIRFLGKATEDQPEFELLPLFNTFVLEDNPMWARDAEGADENEGDEGR